MPAREPRFVAYEAAAARATKLYEEEEQVHELAIAEAAKDWFRVFKAAAGFLDTVAEALGGEE